MIRRTLLKALMGAPLMTTPDAMPGTPSAGFGQLIGFRNNGIVVANQVIVFGTKGGIFVYNGTPAFDNLIYSETPVSGTDSFGNAYLQGTTTYYTGTPRVAINLFGINISYYTAVTEAGPWTLQEQIAYQPGPDLIEITGPVTIDGQLIVNAFAFAKDPAGPAKETLHSLSGFATGFSVGGAAQYQMLPDGRVEICLRNIAYNGTGTSTDGATILSSGNGLPAAYRPASAKRLAATANQLRQPSAGVFESCAVEVETDGSLQIYGFANAATRLDCHGTFNLQAV